MSRGRKVGIGILVVIILSAAAGLSVSKNRDKGIEVRMEAVTTRDLVATVTASGNIRARRSVDISADVLGRIIELNVDEGDDVDVGHVLLRIDPSQLQAAVNRSQAALSQTRAQASQQQANSTRAERDYRRASDLRDADSLLVSVQEVEDAFTNVEVQRSLSDAARFGVEQAEAALEEAEDRLSKTIIRAPMEGKITRLNVEMGETVVVGTMNNPGSLILTISDLSIVEAVMEVDETDVPQISIGDSAAVTLDAFPDEEFTGRVTEIGNSSILPPTQGSGQTSSIDFEVVITLDEPPVTLRPDLSASADIVTDVRPNSLSIPIISLTVRDEDESSDDEDGEADEASASATDDEETDTEGVFVVRDGTVSFVPTVVGIVGEEHFEVLSGLSEGDTVVSGPYARIRELQDGDAVKPLESGGGE